MQGSVGGVVRRLRIYCMPEEKQTMVTFGSFLGLNRGTVEVIGRVRGAFWVSRI